MCMNTKKLFRTLEYLMTSIILLLSLFGTYSFFTAPPKAKAAQDEIERQLRENQEKAEEMKRQQKEKAAQEEKEKREQEKQEEYTDANQMHVVGIGDSVMLAALPQMYEVFPSGYFDAVFGRTIYDGMKALNSLEAEGALGDVIVFGLGTNCKIYEEDCEELIKHSGGRPTFWLSTYGVDNDSNQIMLNVIARHSNAYYIDWETLALEHQSAYISTDYLHPNETGSYAFAELIREEITRKLCNHEQADPKR